MAFSQSILPINISGKTCKIDLRSFPLVIRNRNDHPLDIVLFPFPSNYFLVKVEFFENLCLVINKDYLTYFTSHSNFIVVDEKFLSPSKIIWGVTN